MIGCHSVMERPELVSRVAPPTRIMATMRSAMLASQRRKALAWPGAIVVMMRPLAAMLGAVALGIGV